jgi:septal ring-binding cell division protein DamX
VPPAPPAGDLTRARFSAAQEWLNNAPPGHYSIQLLTAGTHDLRRIEDLLERAAGSNLALSDFHVYGVRINEQQHYRLTYGLYPTLAEAARGIKDLPPVYLQFGSYYRSVARMRSQNQQ